MLKVLQLTDRVTQPSNFFLANNNLCTEPLCQEPSTLELVALSLQISFELRDANCLQGLHAGHTRHAYDFAEKRQEESYGLKNYCHVADELKY